MLPEFSFLPQAARSDDDNDFEWPHVYFMDREGVLKLPYPRIVEIWKANMNAGIWVANKRARELMDQGVVLPETGSVARRVVDDRWRRQRRWNDNSTPVDGALVCLSLLYGNDDYDRATRQLCWNRRCGDHRTGVQATVPVPPEAAAGRWQPIDDRRRVRAVVSIEITLPCSLKGDGR